MPEADDVLVLTVPETVRAVYLVPTCEPPSMRIRRFMRCPSTAARKAASPPGHATSTRPQSEAVPPIGIAR